MSEHAKANRLRSNADAANNVEYFCVFRRQCRRLCVRFHCGKASWRAVCKGIHVSSLASLMPAAFPKRVIGLGETMPEIGNRLRLLDG